MGECPPQSEVNNECLFDQNCKGDKKCCTDGCFLKCLSPLKGSTTTSKSKMQFSYLFFILPVSSIVFMNFMIIGRYHILSVLLFAFSNLRVSLTFRTSSGMPEIYLHTSLYLVYFALVCCLFKNYLASICTSFTFAQAWTLLIIFPCRYLVLVFMGI